MDLLGSILGNMTKPPSVSDKEKERRKKERELAKKMEEKQREDTKIFRQKTEAKLNAFQKDETLRKLRFAAMSKYERSLVHDVADVAGLVAHSFGVEDEDRAVVVWKKEFAPCEEELESVRNGQDDWDPIKSFQAAKARIEQEKHRREEAKAEEKSRKDEKFIPKTNYQQKYEHLIGKDAALDAAQKTQMNLSYGMVSSESKRDKRTMEQIQADIRAKKRQKLEDGGGGGGGGGDAADS